MRPTPQRAEERSQHFVLAVHTARHTVSVGDVQGHKLFFGNRDTAGVPARRARCLGGALCGKSLLGQRADDPAKVLFRTGHGLSYDG